VVVYVLLMVAKGVSGGGELGVDVIWVGGGHGAEGGDVD
jgi:hypothetical protein